MVDIVKRTSQYIDNESFDETYRVSTVLPVEEDGTTLVRKQNNPTDGYNITDIDENYFGFTKSDGSWYIMFNNGDSWKYLKGDSGYTTAWTNRVGAGYDYFYNIF